MPAEASFVNRHPWSLVVYLLTITIAAFLTPDAWKPLLVPALILMQLAVLAWNQKLDRTMGRILDRLKFLFLFLIAANALLPGAANDHYWAVGGTWLSINLTGMQTGVVMSAQILLVVLTTHVVRSIGDERAFINGLRRMRVAPLMAYSLDTTLALLDGSLRKSGGGGGMGRGDGSGGGGGHGGQRGQGSWLNLFRRAKPVETADADAAKNAVDQSTGVLAAIGNSTSVQNARILQMVLAEFGGILVMPDSFQSLPMYFRMGCIPIMPGMPPYEYWEKPPEKGRIPPNRTDSGVYLTAECLGAKRCIFVKDEDGLYTDDPKKNVNATRIPRISVQELLERNLADLVIEPVVLHNMLNAVNVREIQIINGLRHGQLTRALEGEPVGTIIYVAE